MTAPLPRCEVCGKPIPRGSDMCSGAGGCGRWIVPHEKPKPRG